MGFGKAANHISSPGFTYDAAGQVIRYHNRSDWTQQFVPFGATPLAKSQDGVTRFIHGNHLGSTTFLTNHAGTVTQGLLFYPCGQRWATQGTLKDERFASLEQRDSETSLDPTLFRMYSSQFGRWLRGGEVVGAGERSRGVVAGTGRTRRLVTRETLRAKSILSRSGVSASEKQC